MYRVTINNTNYYVQPSSNSQKKYDVMNGDGKKLLSFGARSYEQYHDKFGHYSKQNHGDEGRRRLYRLRHKNTDYDNPNSSAYWSWHYLW